MPCATQAISAIAFRIRLSDTVCFVPSVWANRLTRSSSSSQSISRTSASARRRAEADVREIDWLLEELRVSLFAQTLGTKQTVSDKRIRKAIAEIA